MLWIPVEPSLLKFLGSSMWSLIRIFMHIDHHTCPTAEQKLRYLQIWLAAIYAFQDLKFQTLLLILTFLLWLIFSRKENILTGTLSGPAMKAGSSINLGLCHPQICCKLNPDSFSTYKQLFISTGAYKALAPSDTSFLPNCSP